MPRRREARSKDAMSDSELQFERADLGALPASTTCTACHTPLSGSYFEVNGQVTCEKCRYLLEGDWNQGSRFGRFARAALFGSGAALAGAALYYAIAKITGYE